MKKKSCIPIFAFLITLVSFPLYAGEKPDEWEQYIWQGNITLSASETELRIIAKGDRKEALGKIYRTFDNAAGIFAEVNISQSSGEVGVGLRQNVGTAADGNRIMAEVYVNEYNGNKRIQYKVRKRDPDGSTLKMYARGYLGDFQNAWENGRNLLIAFARVNDEIWFYTPEKGAGLVKILMMESMTDAPDEAMEIWAWAQDGSQHSFSATVKNVGILYPWW